MRRQRPEPKGGPGEDPDWAARWREQYASAPRLPRFFWAWQFLRRNPEYRMDWNTALARVKAAPNPEEGMMTVRYRTRTTYSAGMAPAFIDLLGGRLVCPLPPGTLEPIYDPRGRERWGLLCGYLDPESMWPESLRFVRTCGALTTAAAIRNDQENLAPEVRDGHVLATFDLSRDLEAQLRIVRRGLRSLQRTSASGRPMGTPRPQLRLLRFQLFLLDAKEQGASLGDLAEAFHVVDPISSPGRARNRKTPELDERILGERLAAARQRREPRNPGGYLELVDHDDDSPV
jgi:hypothetical protein